MAQCSNCFNGCADIVSDKCVKYTGVDLPELGIVNGDSLSVVEEKITMKILEIMTGQAIEPDFPYEALCSFIIGFLPETSPYTLNDIILALVQAICSHENSIESIADDLTELNDAYDVDCLDGVSSGSGTHAIVQSIIEKLCQAVSDLSALVLDLNTNYVKIADLDSLIQSYLDSLPSSTLVSNKMIPEVPMAFFGDPSGKFDLTGAGIGDWDKIYLCNGLNSTPDLRGVTLVGATSMGSNPFVPAVDPGISGNPTYNQGTMVGANKVALTGSQNGPHSHTTSSVVTDPGHVHINSKVNPVNNIGSPSLGFDSVGDAEHFPYISTESATTGISVAVSVGTSGAGEGHANIQPSYGSNYIIYIP